MRMELEEEVVVVVNTADWGSEPQIVKKKISIKDANKCAGAIRQAICSIYRQS